jgi:hypothetical protein
MRRNGLGENIQMKRREELKLEAEKENENER